MSKKENNRLKTIRFEKQFPGTKVLFAAGVLLSVSMFSCKRKTDPQPVVQNPKLTSTMNVNGTPMQFKAGVDGYVLNASYELQQDSFYYFTGTFERSELSPSLKFGFKDYKMRTSNEPVDFGNVLALGTAPYIGEIEQVDKVLQKMRFISNSSGQNVSFSWDFGDGTSTNETKGYVEKSYETAGTYNVTMRTNNGLGCQDEIQKEITTETQDNSCIPVYTPYTVFDSNGVYAYFIADSSGFSGATYIWDFGPGVDTATGPNPSLYLPQEDVYTVCVTKTVGACSYKKCENIAFMQDQPVCLANFEAEYVGEEIVTRTVEAGSVFIEFSTDSGITYSTRYGPQDQSNVVINSISEYLINDNGQPTKKIDLEFDCVLYNEQGQTIEITGGVATIAVAYF